MRKNGNLVRAMLDANAETFRLIRSDVLVDVLAAGDRVESGVELDLWQACLDDGWTKEELDAAFERRFNIRQ